MGAGDEGIDAIYLDMFKCFHDKSFNNGQTSQNVDRDAHDENLSKIYRIYKEAGNYISTSYIVDHAVLGFIKVLKEVSSQYLERGDSYLTEQERQSLSNLQNISNENIMDESTLPHVKDLQKVIKKVQYHERISNNGNRILNDAPVI